MTRSEHFPLVPMRIVIGGASGIDKKAANQEASWAS